MVPILSSVCCQTTIKQFSSERGQRIPNSKVKTHRMKRVWAYTVRWDLQRHNKQWQRTGQTGTAPPRLYSNCVPVCTRLFLWCPVLWSKKPLLGATVEEINCTHFCHLRFKCFCNAAQLNRYVSEGTRGKSPGPCLVVGLHPHRENMDLPWDLSVAHMSSPHTKIWFNILLLKYLLYKHIFSCFIWN